jgi:myosin-crossreactive antigen
MKAWLVGGGIGSITAVAFMIRDGKMTGENISIVVEIPDDVVFTMEYSVCVPPGPSFISC